MAQLTNSPRENTILALEQRKSFSFAVVVRDTSGTAVDLSQSSVTFTLGFDSGAWAPPTVLLEKNAAMEAPTLGTCTVSLQADELAMDPGTYPFVIVLRTAGYSLAIVKGELRLSENVEQTSANSEYSEATAANEGLVVTLMGEQVVEVTVATGIPTNVDGGLKAWGAADGQVPVADGLDSWSWDYPVDQPARDAAASAQSSADDAAADVDELQASLDSLQSERVNLATNPSFEASATGAVDTPVVRENLCPNPRYIGLDSKAGGGSAFWPQEDVATGAPDGRGWTRITADATQTGAVDVGTDAGATADVVEGQTYTGLVHMLAEQSRDTFFVYLGWQDSGGNSVGTTDGQSISAPTVGAWQQLSVTGVAPAGATKAQVRARIIMGAVPMQPGESVGVAQRMIEHTTVLRPYIDGGSTDLGPAFDAHWTGPENASTSVLVTKGTAYPTTSRPLDFSAVDDADSVLGGGGAQAVPSTFGAQSGTAALAIVPNGFNADSRADVGATRSIPLQAGVTYTVSGTVTLAAAQEGTLTGRARAIVAVDSNDDGSGTAVLATGTSAPNEAGSHRVSVTFTIAPGRSLVHLRLYNGSDLSTDLVWWDDILIEATSSVLPWFDGSHAPMGLGRVEWVGPTNNAVSRTIVSDGATPGLVDRQLASGAPWLIAHRGGADVWPEHSLEGYRAAANSGFAIECDVRPLADLSLACIHDSTTTRTMTGDSTLISTLSIDDWRSRGVKSPWSGGNEGTPALWEQVLDEWGGRHLIVVEIKDDVVAQPLIDSIVARHLERDVIVQSFTYSHCQDAAAAGIAAMLLDGSTTPYDPSQLVADRIEFFGPGKLVSGAVVSDFQAAGIKVVPYTIQTAAEWISVQDVVDGAFFDDPWGATDYFPKKTRDPFKTGDPFPGAEQWWAAAGGAADRINYMATSGELAMNGFIPSSGGSSSMRQGWARPVTVDAANDLRMRFTLGIDRGFYSNSSTRWLGVFLGVTTDRRAYSDDGAGSAHPQEGYHILFRRNGVIDIYYVIGGASPTNIGTLDTGEFAYPDQYVHTPIEIKIRSSDITIIRLDDGQTLTVLDTTYRGRFDLHLTMNGTWGSFRDIEYLQIPDAYTNDDPAV